MLEQSSTGRTYTRDAYAPVCRDAHAEVEKLTTGFILAHFHFSIFEECVLDRSCQHTVGSRLNHDSAEEPGIFTATCQKKGGCSFGCNWFMAGRSLSVASLPPLLFLLLVFIGVADLIAAGPRSKPVIRPFCSSHFSQRTIACRGVVERFGSLGANRR